MKLNKDISLNQIPFISCFSAIYTLIQNNRNIAIEKEKITIIFAPAKPILKWRGSSVG